MKYIEEATKVIDNRASRSLQIIHEELKRGIVPLSDFIKENDLDEKEVRKLIEQVKEYLLTIYKKRYEKSIGKITNAIFRTDYEPPISFYFSVFVCTDTHVLFSHLVYNKELKNFSIYDYYILYEFENGKRDLKKVAEGNTKEEFKREEKYGSLLSLKKPSNL